MEGEGRDQNNNLLSSSPLAKNRENHTDKIPPISPGVKVSTKTETKTISENNPPLKISSFSPPQKMSPKKLPVSISMPVLCSILWIFSSISIIGTNANHNPIQNRDHQPGHSSSSTFFSHQPGQILFPEDYTDDDDQHPENHGVEELQTIEDDGTILFGRSTRTGRVLNSNSTQKTNATSRTSSSEENGSSRKASPDVQDIIDGIVKLLGGKVHNGTPPNQNNPPGRPLTSPNPYNLFNPTKPFFPKIPNTPPTPKPTRINNRGPVLPGQQQQQNQHLDQQSSSFEAIPIEALSEFNLDSGSNFGPPFPISGNGGGVIQPNNNFGGNRVIEPPYKQGVPLPEMVIPQQGQQYPPGNNNQQQQQFYQPAQQQNYPGGGNYPGGSYPGGNNPGGNFQNQYQKQPTRYQIVPNTGIAGTQPSYNPFGFEHPHPNTTPASNSPPPSTHLLPPPVSKRPVIKFPTDGDNLEDDEADEARFTTPKVPPPPPPQRISPTLASSVGAGAESSVYPTLLLSSNKNNGRVELVTEFTSSSSSVDASKVATMATTTTTSASPSPGITNKPIFYPNNSYKMTTMANPPPKTTITPSPTTVTTSSSPDLSIHSLPTPPLRPGIVISDVPSPPRPGSNPGGVGSVEVVTADEGHALLGGLGGQIGDIFDVTVTAKQNYGGGSTITPFQVGGPPISSEDEVLTAPKGTEQFVSIDGKRTYFNLHPNTASTALSPTRPTQTVTGTSAPAPPPPLPPSGGGNIGVGSVGAPVPLLPQPPGKTLFNSGTPIRSTSLSITDKQGGISKTPPNIIRRPLTRRPSVPPVRIDTCIVGDDSTCNSDAAEVCRTENGVSSCICRPGFARRRHREPCKAIFSLILSIKLDKLGDKKLNYDPDYFNPSSETYQTIEWETIHALDASLAETSLSPTYVGSKLDAIGFDGKHAVVNATVLLQENGKLAPAQLKKELQKQMIQVLTRHRNNFGKSQLWVEGPISAVSAITDVNECDDGELNDCSSKADCINTFGSFECRCFPGYGDAWEHDKRRGGRKCDSCSGKNYCNGRGECLIDNGHKVCKCAGNYYGSQCDIDGEVLAVAIGASVSAVVIIGLTLACLCMWSRKWKKEEQKAALMSRTLFGGMANQALSYLGGQKTNPYQQHVTMDERLRWAQVAESNMTGNIYVQNDGGMSMGCGMGGPQQLMDTPPMMARRSADTVDTTVDDLFDERGGGPSTKRPRSRASQFQGGSIYYDLEPDQTEIYASRSMMHFPPPPAQFCVPMTPMGHYAQQGRGGFYS